MATWTLIIMLVSIAGHYPNSMTTVPGFTTEEACRAEADRLPASPVTSTSSLHIRRYCIKVS